MSMSDRVRRLTSLSGAAAVAVAVALSSPALGQNQMDGQAQAQTAETIIEAYEAVALPEYDASRRADAEYRAEYIAQRREAELERAELIGELFKNFPQHERLTELMPVRWQAMLSGGKAEEVVTETRELAMTTDDKALKGEALFGHGMAVARATNYDPQKVGEAAEMFHAFDAEDPRNAALMMMTTYYETDDKKLLETYRTIATDYPDAREARSASAKVYQYERIGRPFELAFEEATSGEPVDMSQLRGKVVVIDFWATWCGPCIAEMPHMKKLYAAYKDKGVEFIGVSLDAPRNEENPERDGLNLLRNWVKDNNVTWPQYYQGNGWQSEFSSGWKINSIPAIFLVDQQGRLHTPNARGKLDDLIPELLGIEPIELEGEEQEG
jgi:thiol-disulfide isomerase/thioredoxin